MIRKLLFAIVFLIAGAIIVGAHSRGWVAEQSEGRRAKRGAAEAFNLLDRQMTHENSAPA